MNLCISVVSLYILFFHVWFYLLSSLYFSWLRIPWRARSNQSEKKSTLSTLWKDWFWSSNTLATWCEQLTHWKRSWCWDRLKAEGEEANRGWDGWMASPIQWTLTWANSGRWWGTGKTGVPRGHKESDTTWWLNKIFFWWVWLKFLFYHFYLFKDPALGFIDLSSSSSSFFNLSFIYALLFLSPTNLGFCFFFLELLSV